MSLLQEMQRYGLADCEYNRRLIGDQTMNMKKEFLLWWDSDNGLSSDNPYSGESPMWWAWEGWQAAIKAEREAIATEFMERHEAVKHRNNYWHHAANYVRKRGQDD
jgi:hypothetical protein